MVFLLETFCGHGFKAGDPTAPCYRGPEQQDLVRPDLHPPDPRWATTVITDLFSAVIDE
jgi:hypothetical protein